MTLVDVHGFSCRKTRNDCVGLWTLRDSLLLNQLLFSAQEGPQVSEGVLFIP